MRVPQAADFVMKVLKVDRWSEGWENLECNADEYATSCENCDAKIRVVYESEDCPYIASAYSCTENPYENRLG